jgi:hypothetical protein
MHYASYVEEPAVMQRHPQEPTVTIGARLPVDLYADLRDMSYQQGIPISQLVRAALVNHLAAEREPVPA